MSNRTRIPERVKEEVFLRSKRRCALCFELGVQDPQEGMIAHVDRNSTKNDSDNLVFLCSRHHRELDEGKTLSPEQIKAARLSLYDALASEPPSRKEGVELWRTYEKHVIDLVRSEVSERLGDFFALNMNALYQGHSGVSHEVDLAVEFTIAGLRYLTIFEIKYRSSPLGTQEVLRMAAVARDIGASKAVIVTNVGFSAAAAQLARSSGLNLVHLDASSRDFSHSASASLP